MADDSGDSSVISWAKPMSPGDAALKDTPLMKNASSAVSDTEKGDIGSVGSDVANFALGAASVAEDPLNALISAGLGFLEDVCVPIKTCVQQVTGNSEKLDECSEAFDDVSKDIDALATKLDQITKTGFQNWSGDAKNAATQQVETFVQGVQGTGNTASDISQLLSISATLMEAALNIVNGILATFIEWLIVTWVAALACSFFTFGASDAAATAATTVEASVEGANAADKVEETGSLIERITNILKNLISKLKSFFQEVGKNKNLLGEGKNVLKDGETAAEDAGKAGETAAKDAGKAGEKTNPLAKKWDETKKNFNENITHPVQGLQKSATERGNSSFSSYLLDKSGDEPSRLTGNLVDVGSEQLSGAIGKSYDPSGDNADQTAAEENGASPFDIDSDLKG
jgi:uncharacterized protein YukE